jgi:hypothetical protein
MRDLHHSRSGQVRELAFITQCRAFYWGWIRPFGWFSRWLAVFDPVFLPYRRAASRTKPTFYEKSQHFCVLLWQQKKSKVTAQQHFDVAYGIDVGPVDK